MFVFGGIFVKDWEMQPRHGHSTTLFDARRIGCLELRKSHIPFLHVVGGFCASFRGISKKEVPGKQVAVNFHQLYLLKPATVA